MKIVFSITYYFPYVSGLTICAQRLSEHFAKEYKISVLAIQHQSSLPTEEVVNRVNIRRSVPLIKFHKGFLSYDWIVQSIKLLRQHSVVVINLPQLEGFIPAIIARLMGKRVVVIYHCEVQLPHGFVNRIVQTILETSHKISLSLAHKIVTYTSDYRDHMGLLSRFRVKTVCILPPVPKPTVDLKIQNIFRKNLNNRSIVIGVASRLATEKGIEYLFETIPALIKSFPNRHIQILIAGPIDPVGEEEYKKKIFSLVNKWQEHITFLGSLPQEQIGAFYSLLDVLVLPSVNSTEAFGIVQVEAMLCGTPVIASELYGVRQPITLSKMGRLVPPRSIEALAEAIEDVVKHRKKYIQSPDKIKDIFSLEETFLLYKKVFENAI